MSKKSRRELKANLYENDYDELIYSTEEVIKTKHVPQVKAVTKIKGKASAITSPDIKTNIFGPPISDKSVSCKCNKCGSQVFGVLISFIYSPVSELITPFISYDCTSCKHSGFRSVATKALPPKEFDKTYF